MIGETVPNLPKHFAKGLSRRVGPVSWAIFLIHFGKASKTNLGAGEYLAGLPFSPTVLTFRTSVVPL